MGEAMGHIAAVQALVAGILFAWAGGWKVLSPRATSLAWQSALGKLLPNRRIVSVAHISLGLSEIALAFVLVAVPPARDGAIRVATFFTICFLLYLGIAWRIAPERPCACMGGRAGKISRRSLARAGVLLIFTVVGWPAQEYWFAALRSAPLTLLVVAGELIGLWLLSPEFDRIGPRYGRWLAATLVRSVRQAVDPACSRMPLQWERVERDLRGTAIFGQLTPLLAARTDVWSEGCWRFMTFGALYLDRPATAVFAIPAVFDPGAISASLVDDENGSVVMRMGSANL
jgi:hypothetical protein